MKFFLSLGSNLGDRQGNITRAVELLSEEFGCAPQRVSSYIETRAEGFIGPDFINAAVLFLLPDTTDPEWVLDICQKVEIELGRQAHGIATDEQGCRIYSSRSIDIDILIIDNQEINTERLTVPHPRMKERDFVMIPLTEIIE